MQQENIPAVIVIKSAILMIIRSLQLTNLNCPMSVAIKDIIRGCQIKETSATKGRVIEVAIQQ